MIESEKFEIQGRAHARLRQVRSNAATLKTSLNEYGRRLEGIGRLVRDFAKDPERKNSAGVSLVGHLRNEVSSIEDVSRLLDELATDATTIRELESQISQF